MSRTKSIVNLEENQRYQEGIDAFLDQKMDPDRFMAFRLQQGIYGQRQDGVHMCRIKVPGGYLTKEQLQVTADVLEKYSEIDICHVTTRQDFQIHYIPLKDTGSFINDIATAGLTSREACGNTVRNITSCPLAGSCPKEHTDIAPFLDSAVKQFLRHPLTQHLPRKFKMSFSGCEADCAQGMMHDVGVVAVEKDGNFGFKLVAGGGLGHKPHEAITVEEFIDESQLLPSMEALISLHHRYSDRKRRARARIKFLVDKFGPEGFIEKYQEEYTRTKAAYAGQDYYKGEWKKGQEAPTPGIGAPRAIMDQKQAGLKVVPIRLPIGDITAPQLRGVATLMENEQLTDVRITQDQNMMLMGVKADRVEAVVGAITALGLGLPVAGDDVVACPGTSTCRLGITSSRVIATKINGTNADMKIRASGCHNGCAQPETGDIGIYGEGKRLHGKLIPHYQMYFGGDGRAAGGLALKGPSIPAARIEPAIERVQSNFTDNRNTNENFFDWTRRMGKDHFTDILSDIKAVEPEQINEVISDHGNEADFKVLQLGGGECAGAAQEIVASNFSEAAYERDCRNAFTVQKKYPESFECNEAICRLVGQSLQFVSGQKSLESLTEISQNIIEHANNPGLGETLAELASNLTETAENPTEKGVASLNLAIDKWTRNAADYSQSLDSQLDLASTMPKAGPPSTDNTQIIDLSTYGCPLHYVKARNELRNVAEGEVIELIFASGEPAEQASKSLEADGHPILDTKVAGEQTHITIKKGANQQQSA